MNEGGEGVPLSQLADVAAEAEKFLRYLASDTGLSVHRSDWLARNFENGSVRFDIEDTGSRDVEQVKAFNHGFTTVSEIKDGKRRLNGTVAHRTVLQFSKVADALSAHEKLAFGLFRPDEEAPFEWAPLTKREATDLKYKLTEETTFVGTVQGKIHNIAVGDDLWFQLRRSGSGELVRCEFSEQHYSDVLDAAHERHALVYIQGSMSARRFDRAILKVKVARVKVAPRLSDARYEAFFGSDPDYTGKLTTEDFIDAARAYE